MTNLAPISDFTPQWAVEIFSTKYSNWQAHPHSSEVDENGNPIEVGDIDHEYDPLRCGWIRIYADPTDFRLYDINLKWDIRNKPTGEMVVSKENEWMLGLDMIGKAKAGVFYPSQPKETILPTPSKIVFYVDSTGIEGCYPSGYVTVTGVLTFGGETYTEIIGVEGDGLYVSYNYYNEVTEFNAVLENGTDDYRATISVWAQTHHTVGMREVRIWCDANEDNNFGLIFGGYIKSRFGEIDLDDMKVCYDLVGYAEALQLNEYSAGYRVPYRCEYFDTSGMYGDCKNATYKDTCFRQGASTCYVGDWQTAHHDGDLVTAAGYTCPGYSPDINQPLPYDGWTYDPNYAPVDDPKYAWYPYDYYLALQACCNMMNSIEEGKPTSRLWSLPIVSEVALGEDVDEIEDMIDLEWDREGSLQKFIKYSFAECEGEIMLIRAGTNNHFEDSYTPITVRGTTIGVTRAVENSLPMSHPKGTKIRIPLICWATLDRVPPKLVINNVLGEPELKHTVWDTLMSLAEQATAQLIDSPMVAWVDCYRQLQMTEMDINRPQVFGYDDYLQIIPDDIIEAPVYCLSGVCNRICGQVDVDESNWIYAEMDVNSPGLEDYVDSPRLFGICTEEVSSAHLTALTPTIGRADFQTYAYNYLRFNAFPRLTETIAINGFIPDEHYWNDVINIRASDTDHTYDPLLRWTDPVNRHINLLGAKVNAPDFWKGKANGEWLQSDFIIEGIRWVSKVEGMREFITYLTISRPTQPEEWV